MNGQQFLKEIDSIINKYKKTANNSVFGKTLMQAADINVTRPTPDTMTCRATRECLIFSVAVDTPQQEKYFFEFLSETCGKDSDGDSYVDRDFIINAIPDQQTSQWQFLPNEGRYIVEAEALDKLLPIFKNRFLSEILMDLSKQTISILSSIIHDNNKNKDADSEAEPNSMRLRPR